MEKWWLPTTFENEFLNWIFSWVPESSVLMGHKQKGSQSLRQVSFWKTAAEQSHCRCVSSGLHQIILDTKQKQMFNHSPWTSHSVCFIKGDAKWMRRWSRFQCRSLIFNSLLTWTLRKLHYSQPPEVFSLLYIKFETFMDILMYCSYLINQVNVWRSFTKHLQRTIGKYQKEIMNSTM